MKTHFWLFPLLLIIAISCSQTTEHREYIDLSGTWAFALDTAEVGIEEQWYLNDFSDSVELPGTTDSNQKGFKRTDTTTMHLNRVFDYEGPAWYQKKVTVPENFQDKRIQLFLERTKPSKVWIDGELVGGSIIMQSPQRFDVTEYLSPGEHTITLRIDNSLDRTPYGHNHLYSDDTQTNWNGVIGDLHLAAMPKTYISNLQVTPDVENETARIQLDIDNALNLEQISVELHMHVTEDGTSRTLPVQQTDTTVVESLELAYHLGDNMQLWDEYDQPLYELTAVISNGHIKDAKTVSFGMRNFEANGTHFTINGRTTFLRGKHEAAVFPETGYTPTDVESWKRVLEIAKSWGINHYRFHSYTPPRAAFEAADQVGIYMQPELPFWGGLESDSVAQMQRQEGFALLKEYANHPSFVMFSHGNEIWSGHDRVEANMEALKEFDPRPLYTMGSNNSIGYAPPREVSDFFIGARTPSAGDTIRTHTRLTHAFVDSRDGGILNTQTPSTDFDYSYPISQIDIPVVSHEIGQYQIYPDYDEIEKYDGVLRAWNLEKFQERLEASGMGEMDSIFQKASGAWSALSYKAEMEAALRTQGMAGYQLLDLQDFPGQGTALVGILDAFMDDKGVVSKEKWLQSNNEVVLLLRFPKYVWTTGEKFQTEIQIANYGQGGISQPLKWRVKDKDGTVIQQETISYNTVKQGTAPIVADITLDLAGFTAPTALTVEVSLKGTDYANEYPVWIYPPVEKELETGVVWVDDALSRKALSTLENGDKVLLFPREEDVAGQSVGGLFPPNFWNYEMFKGISESNNKPYSPGTLGLLMEPKHPLFEAFPTDFHTNWQWFSIIKESNPLILDDTPAEYRPTVQVIDNLQRNHKLGLIFEFKVGDGKLLVCMSQLDKLEDKPAARQLYRSILDYMNSEEFNPQTEVSEEQLKNLF
ncbi:glycoside hydrolase family 2 protein [Gracilimonas mengyeensis]|uniref:beta-galactosidase n=1 Tax=Gracilimonas mengyeensis TaxID=1302730 RepID=A0A521BWU6_9BACT|nr:sugar-binding domain-containing protein [Gracilimonas mengyeensis]SMO51071.1 Glycosyl hydrolases family 2 [Gracilimonas mengyeensis]